MRLRFFFAICFALVLALGRVGRIAASNDVLLQEPLTPVEQVSTTVGDTVEAVTVPVVDAVEETSISGDEAVVVTDPVQSVIETVDHAAEAVTAPTEPVEGATQTGDPVFETVALTDGVAPATEMVVNAHVIEQMDEVLSAARERLRLEPTPTSGLGVQPFDDLSSVSDAVTTLSGQATSGATDETGHVSGAAISQVAEQVLPTATDLVGRGPESTSPPADAVAPAPVIARAGKVINLAVATATKVLTPVVGVLSPGVEPASAPVTGRISALVETFTVPASKPAQPVMSSVLDLVTRIVPVLVGPVPGAGGPIVAPVEPEPVTPSNPTVPAGTRPVLPSKPGFKPVTQADRDNPAIASFSAAPVSAVARSATTALVRPGIEYSDLSFWFSTAVSRPPSRPVNSVAPANGSKPSAPQPSAPPGGSGIATNAGSSGASGKRGGGADAIMAGIPLLLVAAWQALGRRGLRLPRELHQTVLLPPG